MTIDKYKKYNSVAAREWPNNVYSFNRNNEKLSSHRKDITNKIIINYFNLTKKELSFKSKRMRNLIKRSSLLRLFNSKGIVKQNNDKINVSIHTFNKRKSKMGKNLFSFNKYLNKFKKYNILTSARALERMNKHNNTNLLKDLQIKDNNSILSTIKLKNNLINYLKTYRPTSSLHLTKSNSLKYYSVYLKNMYYPMNHQINKHNTKLNKLTRSTVKVNKRVFYKRKKRVLQKKKKLLYNKLIKTLPWSFERKKVILYKIVSLRAFYNSILKSIGLSLRTSLNKNLYTIKIKSFNTNKKDKNKRSSTFKLLTYKLPNKFNEIVNKKSIINRKKIKMLKKITNLKFERYIYINNMLEKIINHILIKSNNSNPINNNTKIIKNKLYNEFKKYNIQKLFIRFFSKHYLMLSNIYKLYIDNEKYTGITNNLKYIINKIYNKKVNLNITELKYLHLNADMLSNAVVVKLTKMKNRLRRIIRGTLKLAKLGKPQSSVLLKSNSLYPNNANVSLKGNITFGNLIEQMYNPRLSNILNEKISDVKNFKHSSSNITTTINKDVNLNIRNKTKEIIKNLKHKWITGIKLEGKGRLTNRFASGRTMYKYRAKGNLRSKLKYTSKNYLTFAEAIHMNNKTSKKNPYIPLFRGILIPNLQYVRKNGFRRIGAFGVKLWINNNS